MNAIAITSRTPRKKHVLLLAKDASVRTSLAAVLQLADYHVVPAADHQEALNGLSNHRLDLALWDMNGGGVKDRDNLQSLTTAHPCLPIILLTSLSDFLADPLVHRVHGCFQKPISDWESFLTRVGELSSAPIPGSIPPASGDPSRLNNLNA